MIDPIDEFIDWLADRGIPRYDVEDSLTDLGLMVVPIEDPTNLRFGDEDE